MFWDWWSTSVYWGFRWSHFGIGVLSQDRLIVRSYIYLKAHQIDPVLLWVIWSVWGCGAIGRGCVFLMRGPVFDFWRIMVSTSGQEGHLMSNCTCPTTVYKTNTWYQSENNSINIYLQKDRLVIVGCTQPSQYLRRPTFILNRHLTLRHRPYKAPAL